MKIQFKILVAILAIVFSASCKPRPGSGGGGGGGSVPTADDLNSYIDRITKPENRTCGDVRVDTHSSSRFPIIYPSGKHQWKNEFSKSIADQLDKDYMRVLKIQKIDEGDLSLLGCKGFNYATDDEKKQFWILFLSAVSKPESNFNSNDEYSEGDGTVSTGLLQIDPAAATTWCEPVAKDIGIPLTTKGGRARRFFTKEQMHDPKINLQCGLLMMQRQLMGVKTEPNGKFYQSKLFTSGADYWYWSVLSDKNSNGKKEVIDWFRVHAQRQFKFCNRTNPIDGYTPGLSTRYKEMDCKEVRDLGEKENCEKYIINAKIEISQTDPRVGENPTDNTCRNIDNTSRTNAKTTAPGAEELDHIPMENIGK